MSTLRSAERAVASPLPAGVTPPSGPLSKTSGDLIVEGVGRRFGDRVALADVGFTVGAGVLCGLVGGNGAGKTTLLRIVAGFLDADRGRVVIDGVDVGAHPVAAAARRGVLVEGAPLPPELGVAEYLRLRARLRRADAGTIAARLEEVGLSARARDPIGTLSKGLRQRVAWAEALLGDPPVLVLDEPAAGLDEEERAAVRARLAALRGVTRPSGGAHHAETPARRAGVTRPSGGAHHAETPALGASARAILWASHELADVDAVADTLVVLVEGRVAAAGTPAEVRAQAGVAAGATLRAAVAALGAPP